jgi:hypothetical protein
LTAFWAKRLTLTKISKKLTKKIFFMFNQLDWFY